MTLTLWFFLSSCPKVPIICADGQQILAQVPVQTMPQQIFVPQPPQVQGQVLGQFIQTENGGYIFQPTLLGAAEPAQQQQILQTPNLQVQPQGTLAPLSVR